MPAHCAMASAASKICTCSSRPATASVQVRRLAARPVCEPEEPRRSTTSPSRVLSGAKGMGTTPWRTVGSRSETLRDAMSAPTASRASSSPSSGEAGRVSHGQSVRGGVTAVRESGERQRRARVSRICDGDTPFSSAMSCETSAVECLGGRPPPSLDATEEARVARVAGPTGFRGKQPSTRDLSGTTATPLEVRVAEGCGVGGAEATIGVFDWETPMADPARRAVTAGPVGPQRRVPENEVDRSS